MIALTLTREEASAIITLLGRLSPKELGEKCVSEQHRQVIESLWDNYRDDLPWPKTEHGLPK